MQNFTIRPATVKDIPLLIAARKQQLIDEGIAPTVDIDAACADFFERKLADSTLYELLAFDGDILAATAAVCFYEFPPTYTNATGRVAYITNMYTAPAYRGQGLASRLLEQLESESCRRDVYVIRLRASIHGRPVYDKCGYTAEEDWMIKSTQQ